MNLRPNVAETTVPGTFVAGNFGVTRRHSRAWVRPVFSVFAVALLVRVAAAALLAFVLPDTGLILDDAVYSDMAAEMASRDTARWDAYRTTLYWSTSTYLVPLTAVYELFGPIVFAGQLLTGILGATAAALVTRLALEAVETRWALVAGGVLALLPSQVLWSATTLKDAAVWAVLAALALLVAMAGRVTGIRYLVLALAMATAVYLLGHLRMHTTLVALWAMVLTAWLGRTDWRLPRAATALAMAILMPMILGFGPLGIYFLASRGSLEELRQTNARNAESAYVEREQPSDPEQPKAPPWRAEKEGPVANGNELEANVRHLPRGLVAMLLRPFPWEPTRNLGVFFAKLDTALFYGLLLLAARGMGAALRRPRIAAFPTVAGSGIILMYALGEGNLGTAFRHRGEFVWVVALLAAFGARVVWRRLGDR